MIKSSFRLGTIAGIEVSVNYSLLLIMALVVWQISDLILPYQIPGHSRSVYLAYGVAATIIFCFSILWHELAHSLMALYYKVRVRRIVLYFLGGLAEIEDEPRTAGQEFWIAVVGPLSSLLLGGIFLLIRVPLDNRTLLSAILYWLGMINLILAGFNMLPGFPLDGGRVVRAALWLLTGNHLKATQLVSYFGQLIAYLAIMVGITQIFVPAITLGDPFWNLLLGWFLLQASKAHLRDAEGRVKRETLRGVPIGQLVQGSAALKAEWSLSYAADIMALGNSWRALPVMRDGILVGVLSMDLLQNLPGAGWGHIHVQDIMQPIHNIPTVEADLDLYDALARTDLSDQRYLLVTNQQRPIGFLSHRDLLAFVEQQVL